MPRGDGATELWVLERAIHGLPVPEKLAAKRRAAIFKSANSAGSDNLGVALASAETIVSGETPEVVAWWDNYHHDAIEVGPLGFDESGVGQYQAGFVVGAVAAAVDHLSGETRRKALDILGAQLALMAACSTDFGDGLWLHECGERVQGHHGGLHNDRKTATPWCLILADALGYALPGQINRVRRPSDDPDENEPQSWYRSLRAWCSAPLLVRDWSSEMSAMDLTVARRRESWLALVRLRVPVTIVRWERALWCVWSSGRNGNSIGCGGFLAVAGQEPQYYDVRTDGARGVKEALPPWETTVLVDPRDEPLFGEVVVKTREQRGFKGAEPLVGTFAGSIGDAGRLLSTIEWPGGLQPPTITYGDATTPPEPEPMPKPPLPLEERVAALEARVAALEASR